MKKKYFSIVVAICKKNRGIGYKGNLPWKNSNDLKYFKNITTQRMDENKKNAVIMGKNTYDSLNGKILQNRINVCITSNTINDDRIMVYRSFDEALYNLYIDPLVENIFVIGGETLYKTAINHKDCVEILINELENDVDCDTFFPEINSEKYLLSQHSKIAEDIENKRYILKRSRFYTL